jgi:hypothetical protein
MPGTERAIILPAMARKAARMESENQRDAFPELVSKRLTEFVPV